MKYIRAPWRIQYIKSGKPEGCILCTKPPEKKDKDNYILFRGKKNYIMMNCYPYNPGHLLIIPFRHVGNLEELTAEERNEHYEIVSRCVKVLKESTKPDGFNIGTNIGKVAGAGIESHFHTHVVPRWLGDTNFITSVGQVRVVPQALSENYDTLIKLFKRK
jgi:ATP adenylyltransferase